MILEEGPGQDSQLQRPTARPAPASGERIAVVALGVTAGSANGQAEFARAVFTDSLASRRIETVALTLENLGFPPVDLEQSLAQQTLAMQVAVEALSQTKFDESDAGRRRIGVLVGAGCDPESARAGFRIRLLDRNGATTPDSILPPWSSAGVLGRLTNIVANRISNANDFRGPSFAVAGEELSGLTAMDLGCRFLRHHELDAVLVGAVDLSCEAVHEAAIHQLSPDREPGDAGVFVVLKRMADALAAGDRILAEVDPPTGDSVEIRTSPSTAPLFGSAHAASGLLDAAAAIVRCAAATFQGLEPWIAEGRRFAGISVTAVGGGTRVMTFGSVRDQPVLPVIPADPPRVIFCGGTNREELGRSLRGAWNRVNDVRVDGPMRLAIVASNESDWNRKSDRALRILEAGVATFSSDGIHFREKPVRGELAFVFPGAASSYAGMGRSLFAAFPEIFHGLLESAPRLKPWIDWVFDNQATPPGLSEKLAATTVICQAHARFTRSWLKLKPTAAIGMSAGETNALLAFDVWREGGGFFEEFVESGVFSRYLGGKFEVVGGTPWEAWSLSIPEEQLRKLLADQPRLRLLAVHAPGEFMIAGDAESCSRAVETAGRGAAQPVDFPAIVHCPELAPFAETWRRLHNRETWPPPEGVRIYQLASGTHYAIDRDSVADALTAQALGTLDYPRVIRQAWEDGVRVFVEHGARGSCASWIRKILGDREHLAVALDSPVADALTQAIDAAAQLVVAGVDIDLANVFERLRAIAPAPSKPRLRIPAHPPQVVLSAAMPASERDVSPGVLAAQPKPAGPLNPMQGHGSISQFEKQVDILRTHHSEFLEMSLHGHNLFLEASRNALQQLFANGPVRHPQVAAPPGPSAAVTPAVRPAPRSLTNGSAKSEPPEPKSESRNVIFNRAQLEVTASGKISSVFGKQFEPLDSYAVICRLPMPPMLLVDRVTHLEGQPGTMGLGSIHTETDIREDSWFLHRNRIPAGLMIEAGQADMLLISWLGIDFQARGSRVYRMLGCEVTFHSRLAQPGDTLRYEIRVTGHARQGEIRIFFFEYDCFVGDRLVLSVRNGQAGFFSTHELSTSVGVLWDPNTTKPREGGKKPVPGAPVASRYVRDQVRAAARGDAYACCGEGFAPSAAQSRPPSFAELELLQFDAISELNFDGGPWQRGYVRADSNVQPDSFLFTSHFKDDPCLPGTVMLEGCYQLMAFYMMAMGLTLNRDGWRFEPVAGEPLTVLCRGQVLPTSRELTSELFVEEFVDGAEPVLFVDTLGTVDGQRAFYGKRLGLRLVPGNLLDSGERAETRRPPTTTVAREAPVSLNGVLLDHQAMLATSSGAPSAAFGAPYAMFDGFRRCPRLPNPPYNFVSRVVGYEGEFGVEKAGCSVEAEYDVYAGDWYFSDNGEASMPYSVLLEVGLQPCGWLSCFTGVPLHSQADVFFRNLDGTAHQHRTVPVADAVISTRAKLASISRFGSITLVSLEVKMLLDGEPLLDMTTSFGFFGHADLASQVGLPLSGRERADFPSDFHCDLRERPSRYFEGGLRLASGRLLMLDEITGLSTPTESTQGRVRARKNIRPSDWYFKAHFFQDPVQPGSLGLEALIQTLQFYAISLGLGDAIPNPMFELGEESTWKYRGQATPLNRVVETEVAILEVENTGDGCRIAAEGWLQVDQIPVYHHRFELWIRSGGVKSPSDPQ
ncbi:MAG: beta-ketoacyl synthase N-terminal-like domain-containing protein [Bryobacteraceae bacterium]